MTQKELIRQEIERLKTTNPSEYNYRNAEGYIWAMNDLLAFIDSLPEEKPSEDLVKEVKRYYFDNFTYISSDQPTLSILTNVARHFAEWQKKQAK